MAIQYLGTSISGVSGDTKPTLTSNEVGVIFIETNTNKSYIWDSDSWNEVKSSVSSTSATGVASFSSDNFAVSGAGAVTIKDDGVILGTETTGNYVAAIAGTANEIEISGSGSEGATVTIGIPTNPTLGGNVTISGNLTVSGTTTTVSSSTITVNDPLISLATNNTSADAVDIGIYGTYDTSGSQDLYGGLFRDANDSGKWKLFKDLQAAPTTTVNTSGTGYAVGTLVASLEGNADTVTNGVYTTGNQTIAGTKTFSSTIAGSINGTAAIATTVTLAGSGNVTYYPTFVDSTSGNEAIRVDTDGDWTYNASTNKMTVTNIGIPDSGKIEFGASQDLQIYHNGSNSHILDNGAGNFLIGSNGTEIRLHKNAADDFLARFVIDGSVMLYHNNALKFETTSTGATITGKLTSTTGAVINSSSADSDFQVKSQSNAYMIFMNSNENNIGIGQYTELGWHTAYFVMGVGAAKNSIHSTRTSDASDWFSINHNAYLNTSNSWTYQDDNSAGASNLYFYKGQIRARVAVAGTAGNAITWKTGFNINERGQMGIGTNDPFNDMAGNTSFDQSTSIGQGLHIKDSSTHAQITLEGNPPSLTLVDLGGGSNDKYMQQRMDGGILKWYSTNDSGSAVADNILILDHGTGNVGIGKAPAITPGQTSNIPTDVKLDVIKTLAGTTSTLDDDDFAAVNIYAHSYGNTITNTQSFGLFIKNDWAGYNTGGTFTGSEAIGAKIVVDASWGVLPAGYGLIIEPEVYNSQTMTTFYSLLLNAPTLGSGATLTNAWGVYQSYASAKNYFAGKVAIGNNAPHADSLVDIKNGSTYTSGNDGSSSGSHSDDWLVRIQQNTNVAMKHGLSVMNAWANVNSVIFEAAMGWNGSAVGYYPVYTIDGLGNNFWRNGSPATEKMRLTTDGNLGIGTTPAGGQVKLHIKGGSNLSGGNVVTFKIDNSTTGTFSSNGIGDYSAIDFAGADASGDWSGGETRARVAHTIENSYGSHNGLAFYTSQADAALVMAMKITHEQDTRFYGANYHLLWDKSDNALEFADGAVAKFGTGADMSIGHVSNVNTISLSNALTITGSDTGFGGAPPSGTGKGRVRIDGNGDYALLLGSGTLEGTARNESLGFLEANNGAGGSGIRWLNGSGGWRGVMYGSVSGNNPVHIYANGGIVLAPNQGAGVGVGTTTPYTLSNYEFITIHHATNGGGIVMQDGSGRRAAVYNGDSTLFVDVSSTGSIDYRFGGTAPGGTVEFRMEADGDFHADGDVYAFSGSVGSDIALKENINVIDNALDKVSQLKGISFDWKRKDKGSSAGLIAQDVEKVLPELVTDVDNLKDNGLYKYLNYNGIIGLLVESIKELKDEVRELKNGD